MTAPTKPLSGPHKRFADAIFGGKNKTEAYCVAYPKATRIAARKHAGRLVANGGITAEIARLNAATDKKSILTKERALELLTEIAEDKQAEETRDRIAAMKTAGTWSSWETVHVQVRVDNLGELLARIVSDRDGKRTA